MSDVLEEEPNCPRERKLEESAVCHTGSRCRKYSPLLLPCVCTAGFHHVGSLTSEENLVLPHFKEHKVSQLIVSTTTNTCKRQVHATLSIRQQGN